MLVNSIEQRFLENLRYYIQNCNWPVVFYSSFIALFMNRGHSGFQLVGKTPILLQLVNNSLIDFAIVLSVCSNSNGGNPSGPLALFISKLHNIFLILLSETSNLVATRSHFDPESVKELISFCENEDWKNELNNSALFVELVASIFYHRTIGGT